MTDELDFVSRLVGRFGSGPSGETWIGDDAAVVRPPSGPLLLAIDPMVEGVHFEAPDRDAGWRAVARNVSDLAAMGGRPLHTLVSLVIPPDADISLLLDGLVEATSLCPVVGGDTSGGPALVVTVAVTGTVDGEPVLRSGARPGDTLFVTGPLGAAPARPVPRVAEGAAARVGGASAMIDVSDGLALDLRRLADASGVGFVLDAVPVIDGVDPDRAITWGEDYELVFAAPDENAVLAAFAAAGLERPIELGRCTADSTECRLGDGTLPEGGWGAPVVTALTIAGSDSGGGAGIQADLKTFEALGVWGTSAVVAVTAQNTVGVQAFETLPADLVREQIRSVVTDIGVQAAKTGMLATAELVGAVADALAEAGPIPLVVDPVFVSKHGDTLLADDAVDALRRRLLPMATVVTPNIPEAEALTGLEIRSRDDMRAAAEVLGASGVRVVMVKGGHLDGPTSPDLVLAGGEATWLEGERIPGRHTHGTGCTLSAAITAELAKGMDPVDACRAGKHFVERAIAGGLAIGRGVGPVNPGWERLTGPG